MSAIIRATRVEPGMTVTTMGHRVDVAQREAFDRVVAAGLLPARFDAQFIGLWRYYLMYCEGGFRGGAIDVAQVTLVKEG